MTLASSLPLSGLDAAPVSPRILERLAAFAFRWYGRAGNEQQLAQSFLIDLCDALGTAKPNDGTFTLEDFTFEKKVVVPGVEHGRIDLYKRGHFVLEAKCGRESSKEAGSAPVRGTKAYDRYIERAFWDQGRLYATRIPEGLPPLVIVADVGWKLWIWRKDGDSYGGYHSPKRIEIPLDRIADEDHARIVLACFEAPETLDPSHEQERVTREAAGRIAELAQSLDRRFKPDEVARFLMRCLFCMFAEDADLLEHNFFTAMLHKALDHPEAFAPELARFFETMDRGGTYDFRLVRRFNGALFHDASALPLEAAEIRLLADAALLRWDRVDPSIFGTLLERALDPRERKRLGAHYTPRAYVERLVRPTIEEPLRREWEVAQARADEVLADETLAPDKRTHEAAKLIEAFRERLARVRVLDPACGTGNFLYISYAILKGLEHEVLEALRAVTGATQGRLALHDQAVVPSHFLGLEIKPWAAEIAQLVLWIGHLQWLISHGQRAVISEPVLGEERSIQCRDALITATGTDVRRDATGAPALRWDGLTTLVSPTTGKDIPDPSALVTDKTYLGVERAPWPEADFIVGNPPFIGNKTMREQLGDGYVEAVRGAYCDEVPDTVDFVMYWWHRAAEAVRSGGVARFGLITTNSLRQTQNRQVTAYHLEAQPPLVLSAAIADHPWVDESGSAAVRIAMTIGDAGRPGVSFFGRLGRVTSDADTESPSVAWETVARIHADLSAGADVSGTVALRANDSVSFQGMNLVGKGFRLSDLEIASLGYDPAAPPAVIRPYLNARELMQKPVGWKVIDAFGLSAEEVAATYPGVYQWLRDHVKPERDQNRREGYRLRWWAFGEVRGRLRARLAGLKRYIVTAETSKHRVFAFMPAAVCPDHTMYAIALDSGFALGVLSATPHTVWSPSERRGTLEDRPTLQQLALFSTRFPFPDRPSPRSRARRWSASQSGSMPTGRKPRARESRTRRSPTMYNLLASLQHGTVAISAE
jgi:hypothetical protein